MSDFRYIEVIVNTDRVKVEVSFANGHTAHKDFHGENAEREAEAYALEHYRPEAEDYIFIPRLGEVK